MSEASPHPLTDTALKRLQKVAEGNDVAPESIRLLGSDEQFYTLKGVMKLEPFVEKAVKFYPGPAIGKGVKIQSNASALQAEIEQVSERARRQSDWIPAALEELRAQDGHGWGQGDAQITPKGTATILATSAPCPSCRGQKMLPCSPCGAQGVVVCPICHGSRYEVCYGCNGTGLVPGSTQPCTVCNGAGGASLNGRRAIACRTCQGRGQITCPTCHGRRGNPCGNCKSTGLITEEVSLTLTVRTHFTMITEEVPSGLRRALDRLGTSNLAKGHADIEMVPAPIAHGDAEEEALPAPEGYNESLNPRSAALPGPQSELHYEARLPYADLRMDFNGKKALVSAFGKKGLLLGVPPFLDTALEPARTKLLQATKETVPIDTFNSVRVFRDAFALRVTGKRLGNDLRRKYPLGLSAPVADEILKNMRLALHRLTLKARVTTASCVTGLSACLFGVGLISPVHEMAERLVPSAIANLLPLMVALLASWIALNFATAHQLRKAFPAVDIPAWQKTGVIGYVTIVGIFCIFVAILLMTTDGSAWLNSLRTLHRPNSG